MVVIAVIVFTPAPPDEPSQRGLISYLAAAHRHGLPHWISYSLVEGVSNAAMFVPLGLFGALALRRRNFLVVPTAALLAGIIELVQLLFLPDRVASWADIEHNTVGAIIGLLIAAPVLARRRRRVRAARRGVRSARDRVPR